MKNINECKIPSEKHTVTALGIFDGIHLGHRLVINKVLEYSSENILPAVFTFNSDTMKKKHNKPFRFIYPNSQKMSILEELGIEYIYCPEFDDIKDMNADEFARIILCGKMNIKKAVCGKRFRFGKGASCGTEELRKLGKKYGFEVCEVPPVLYENSPVSSSRIRSLLSDGNIKRANILLDRNYEIENKIKYGRQLGRTIGVPTANQQFRERQLIPHYAVYASTAFVNGKKYPAVTDIGVKPTVEENSIPLAETHIIGFNGNIYGKNIKVTLNDIIRQEQKFTSIDELKSAIENDIKTALTI